MKRLVSLSILLAVALSALISCGVSPKEGEYKEALKLIDSGDYAAAQEILTELGDYKDAKDLLCNFRYVLMTKEINTKYPNGMSSEGPGTIMTYNEDGLLSVWISGDEKYEYFYDENKKLIKETHTTQEGTWPCNEYVYDEKGNLVKETNYAGKNPLYSSEYTYDDRGNMIRKVELYNRMMDMPYMEMRYTQDCTYDENDRLIADVTTWSNGSKDYVNYIYDQNGQLIRKERPTDSGAEILTEYTYNQSGKLLKEANVGYVIEWTYDENGNLIKHWEYNADNFSAVRYIYEYTYNESGLLLRETYVGYGYNKSSITTDYTYDQSGSIVKKCKEERRAESVTTYTYTYDTNGNLTEYIDEASSGTVSEVKMTYMLVYAPYEVDERIEGLIRPTY